MDLPEHSCGTCIACCYALAFNAEEGLRKKAGDMCPNCTGSGCAIYETRFKLCRIFMCAWRVRPAFAEDWRPDKSGVMLMEIAAEEAPEGYREAGTGMEFLILTDESAIRKTEFIEYVCTLISRQVPVYLSVIGTPRTIVNGYLDALVAAQDFAGVTQMLVHVFNMHLEAKRIGLIPEQKDAR